MQDSFFTKSRLNLNGREHSIFDLGILAKSDDRVRSLPFSLKILLENLLRHEDGRTVRREDIEALLAWDPKKPSDAEIAFRPARVLMQDFTGVPAIVDLAAMRDAMRDLGGDPTRINPIDPVDLVVDHSVQVDRFGSPDAFAVNAALELERNQERYRFLRWGQASLAKFRVVPPATGIVHQVNLEYLAQGVWQGAGRCLYPDTVVGTDSHTPMINALGVLGWGVGGIEAEAAMLGQPLSMLIPEVVGVRLEGSIPEGVLATDAVLTLVEMLRRHGVVGKFVEFCGPGLDSLSVADRATLSNMAPEYGATVGFFPVDRETLSYLKVTNRAVSQISLLETYCKRQGLLRKPGLPEPRFSDQVTLRLDEVVPCLAGPQRPQERVPLKQAKQLIQSKLPEAATRGPANPAVVTLDGTDQELGHGAVVIAAITSCTNTSNPTVMIGAGLLAKHAVQRGLRRKPWVKTSLAPGSKVVMDYLKMARLDEPLASLGFHLVGYGCTTCIGNSGPLPPAISEAVQTHQLVLASVLSGNRNFEGRINPLTRWAFLASPPLVVAYALAGTMLIDFETDPLGQDVNGRPVFLRDLWPSAEEIRQTVADTVQASFFEGQYAGVFQGDERWQTIHGVADQFYAWDDDSTYIRKPPFFDHLALSPTSPTAIQGARVLAWLGDTVTTDHISPAGAIPVDSPAGHYLMAAGVAARDFNSYGARRGNHEVMVRGTFANIRLQNRLVPGVEGGYTIHWPTGEKVTIFEAATRYQRAATPLLVLAGQDYGAGSSRDWAAKGARLLGVSAVVARSFERIHRANLVGMGVLPLQFREGQDAASLGLTGQELFDIDGLQAGLAPRQSLLVRARLGHGPAVEFEVLVRVDTPNEVDYYHHGGILPYVLRQLVQQKQA